MLFSSEGDFFEDGRGERGAMLLKLDNGSGDRRFGAEELLFFIDRFVLGVAEGEEGGVCVVRQRRDRV